MFKSTFTAASRLILAASAALAVAACGEPTSAPFADAAPSLHAVKDREPASSIAWNQTARDLIASRAITSTFVQVRILTYLSVAQYNAVVTAEDAKKEKGGDHASPAAAAAGASLVVLKSFFPLDAGLLDGKLLAQQTEGAGKHEDFAAGEAIGRAVGAQVLAYAATDKVGLTVPPANPGGPGKWTGVNSVRGNYGARAFALTSGDQFRPAPPPAFGSPEFNAALAEIRALSDGLTPEQLLIAQTWNPRGPAYMNSVGAAMIVDHHRSERDAARILALANMAAFDVANACFDAKFAYYLIRPSQADPMIKLPIGLPNHPSYPSGHSCFTAAYGTVFARAFPKERELLDAMVEEAGLSRMYGGLHYRFDCEVGQELGRQVAAQVLRTAPRGHEVIPLD
jgi:membrane-associated phospholipid phosphatase